MDSRYGLLNGVQEMSSPKFMVADHKMKEFQYENGNVDKSDSFVVDLENVANGVDNETTNLSTNNSNSRISLQRSLSRKKVPLLRGIERKINDKDTLSTSLSPRGAAQATTTPEKSLPSVIIPMLGSQDNSVNHQLPQHQITMKTGGQTTVSEGRWGIRRSSFKRSPSSWIAHPKRILLFFATLSCMGTMLLIYFTLSMNKHNEKEGVLDWQ